MSSCPELRYHDQTTMPNDSTEPTGLSGFFASSSQVAILGGHFIQNNGRGSDNNNNHLGLLYDEVAPNAILNAGGRLDPVRCYPGTREEVIRRLDHWMESGHISDRRICWLSGPAGAGKSAISQTIAELWIKRKFPVANFFFLRGDPSRSHIRSVVATILYQIFNLYPELKGHINSIIGSDPVILRQAVHTQFRRLIQEPVIAIRQALPSQLPIVLLIDGLDECESQSMKEDQKILLRVLHDLVTSINSPFIALVASRPEPHLTMVFNEIGTFHDSIFLDASYRPADDIQLFIVGELASIKNTHHLGHSLDNDWPSQAIITSIVNKSSGQFVYAATVARFIRNSSASPAISMATVLGLRPSKNISPFAEIDGIYTHILAQVQDWDAVRDILATYRMLKSHGTSRKQLFLRGGYHSIYPGTPTNVLSALGYRWGDVESCLADLKSIVELDNTGSEGHYSSVNLHHASLEDFLYDQTRAGRFYIDLNSVACVIVAALFRHYPVIFTGNLVQITYFLDYVTQPSDALNKFLQHVKFLHNSSGLILRQVYPELTLDFLGRVDELVCMPFTPRLCDVHAIQQFSKRKAQAACFEIPLDSTSKTGKLVRELSWPQICLVQLDKSMGWMQNASARGPMYFV